MQSIQLPFFLVFYAMQTKRRTYAWDDAKWVFNALADWFISIEGAPKMWTLGNIPRKTILAHWKKQPTKHSQSTIVWPWCASQSKRVGVKYFKWKRFILNHICILQNGARKERTRGFVMPTQFIIVAGLLQFLPRQTFSHLLISFPNSVYHFNSWQRFESLFFFGFVWNWKEQKKKLFGFEKIATIKCLV